MSEQLPDRSAPEYIQAVVEKKPHADDPKDIRIQQIIKDRFLQQPWAQDAFTNIREEQIAYLKDVVRHVDDPEYVDKTTQETLERISSELRAEIEEGAEHLEPLRGKAMLVMTNHLGTYKLTGINPQTDLGEDVVKYGQYDFMYPYPLYFAGLWPVAEKLDDALSYTSDDFPGVFGQVHTEAGFIHVPPASVVTSGRTEALIQQTAELIRRKPSTALVNFPEGGTSGKYNEAGPYDLLDFKTGGYVIAAELGIPVLMVAQYFDPQAGMRLKVFEPQYPQSGSSREDFQTLATNQQTQMQAWLTGKEQAQSLVAART